MTQIFSDWGQKEDNSIVKIIGVGGGGGNAVRHMYTEGIVGVNFLICNTDRQALEHNPVPLKLILGESGLGAGANPEVARVAAEESVEQIKEFLGTNTKMLFIAAGMGKGTGTGASPVIARVAKEMGILTIGVVTYPFEFEGGGRKKYANEGIKNIKEQVDSLLVVNNQNIIKYYNDDDLDRAFSHADDVLKNAVKCIAELITVNADQNIDFNDIKTVMKDSGVALLGLAQAQGENRIEEVLEKALTSPLLNDNDVTGAKNFLFFISYGSEQKLTVNELQILTDRFKQLNCNTEELIWGRSENPDLGTAVQLSIVATGFNSFEKNTSEPKKPAVAVEEIPVSPVNEVIPPRPTPSFDWTAEIPDVTATRRETWQNIPNPSNPSNDLLPKFGPSKVETATLEDLNRDDERFYSVVNEPAIWQVFQNQKKQAMEYSYKEIDDDSSAIFRDLPD